VSESGEYRKDWRDNVMRGIELISDRQASTDAKIEGKDGLESRLTAGETTLKTLWKLVWTMITAAGVILLSIFGWLLSNVKLT
jgi:hypothetical protein